MKKVLRGITVATLLWSVGQCTLLASDIEGSKTAQIGPSQNVTVIDVNGYLQQYIDVARKRPDADRAALYAKYVYEPLVKRCGEGGEYYEFGKYNLIRA